MDILQADPSGVARAAALLRAGSVVAFGTETVYGLGGVATNPDAVAAIFAAKGRPRFNPLIAHYASAEAALEHVVADERAYELAERFWPGPLTLVLRRKADCPIALLATAGLDTVAIRVPSHPVARALLDAVGLPLAAPSANRSGQVSPTTAQHVALELKGRIDAILDSGPCQIGIESTVVSLAGSQPLLLRPGGVTKEALEREIGPVHLHTELEGAERPQGPGMLTSHYAPKLTVRLNAHSVAPDEALLAFGPALERPLSVFQLSPQGNEVEAAARLYEGLRWLDAEGSRLGARGIAVMPVPNHGIGMAINDRLHRAAAPRSGT